MFEGALRRQTWDPGLGRETPSPLGPFVGALYASEIESYSSRWRRFLSSDGSNGASCSRLRTLVPSFGAAAVTKASLGLCYPSGAPHTWQAGDRCLGC